MADDLMFVIGVDDRDLIRAKKEQLKFQRNLILIEKAYRSGDITAKRYNQELARQAKQLQALGGSYRVANSEVRRFSYQLRQADEAALASSESVAFAGKRINRLGANMQQAGYQIGDFAVQVQGGTNVMVALGQQGAQLLGIFGPAGAIAGAALAITTAFLAPLMRAKDAAKGLEDQVKDSVKNIQDSLRASGFGAPKEELPFIDKVAAATVELEKAQARLDQRRKDVLTQGETSPRFWKREQSAVDSATASLEEANKVYQDFLSTRAKLQAYDPLSPFGGLGDEAYSDPQVSNKIVDKTARDYEDILGTTKGLSQANEALNAVFQRHLDKLDLAKATLAEMKSLASGYRGEFENVPLGLDAFGGGGDYRYDLPRTFKPERGKPSGSVKKSPLQVLKEQITLEKELLGRTQAQQRVIRSLGVDWKKYGEGTVEGLVASIEEMDRFNKKVEEQERIASTIKNSMEDAFMSMVDGTQSAKDAFKDMARMIVAELYKVLVVQQMVGSFKTGGGGILGSIAGIFGRASGGTVMPNQPYLVGEKGPEIIMPQNRGHVMNADLTSKAMSGGEQVSIVQNFNFSANGDESVKKLIAQAAPQIANLTQKQIMDSRRRGGALKATFG